MHCDPIEDSDGKVIGFICGRNKKRRPKCVKCRRRPGTQLCDHKLQPDEYRARGQTTCDAPLCKTCSHRMPGDLDFCPLHADSAPQLSLFG